MGTFKLRKKSISFGKWKKKMEISIPTYDLEIEVYNLPFKIGSSPNNDLVLQEGNLDTFQGVILESGGFLQLFNISLYKPINLDSGILYPFQSIQLKKSTQVNFGNVQLMLMPEIKNKRLFKRKKRIYIQCPYCGETFDPKNKCPVCGFGKEEIEKVEKVSRFSRILKRKEKEVEPITVRRNFGGVKGTKLQLILENGPYKGKVIGIPENSSEITIGRSIYNAVSLSKLNDVTMSRFHCKLYIKGNKVSIVDNHSLNGTFVNGKPISKKVELLSGDIIQLGDSILRVKILGEEK